MVEGRVWQARMRWLGTTHEAHNQTEELKSTGDGGTELGGRGEGGGGGGGGGPHRHMR